MERDRDEDRRRGRFDQRRHVAGHGPRNRDLAAIFEANGKAPAQIPVSDRGASSLDPRRIRQANAAGRCFRCLKREPAGAAPALPEKFDAVPAIDAEAVSVSDDRTATSAAGRKGEIESLSCARFQHGCDHSPVVAAAGPSHKRPVSDLFEMGLRASRRDRAARLGPELFLLERAFADCLDRIALVQQRFERALLIGCPDPAWRDRLRERVGQVDVIDPGPTFAEVASGTVVNEDEWLPQTGIYDLVVALGTLDTVNDLPRVLFAIRQSMTGNAFLIGAMSGGETLPRLRAAMRAADEIAGVATPHVHPRIEASALAPLLQNVGFATPVVDVDRVQVSYGSFTKLVADLRRMGATNLLSARSRSAITRRGADAAATSFSDAGHGGKTIESFEILHFAAWTPTSASIPREG